MNLRAKFLRSGGTWSVCDILPMLATAVPDAYHGAVQVSTPFLEKVGTIPRIAICILLHAYSAHLPNRRDPTEHAATLDC